MRFLLNTLILFSLTSCISPEIIKLASEYQANINFFEQAQKSLRKILSDCNYERECFEENATNHIKTGFCPKYEEYNFVSASECERAGQGIMDLILGKTEFGNLHQKTGSEISILFVYVQKCVFV